MKKAVLLSGLILMSIYTFSQGVIQTLNTQNGNSSDVYCGAHFLTQKLEQQHEGFLKLNAEMIQEASEASYRTNTNDTVYIIPVVFHVVYNNEEENLPDSVIHNQIALLNTMYRRQNADTVNLREVFMPYVGDARIEFRLADTDPDGNPTTGIVRTPTNIADFGGVLPYSQGQNQQIQQWVNDSLLLNMFRITQTENGGDDPWDMDKYLNIWSGDLRINEPAFNVEELLFMALATPPMTHPNFPPDMAEAFVGFNQGVLVHYINVGSNNPNEYPAPYTPYNGLVNKGKTIIHEVGHYLGLRHIWGDGGCNMTDYIWDTPNAANQSPFSCNHSINSCVDNIEGLDLPDMVENYMDYSNADCQNSFTLGQIAVMRQVLRSYRPDLPEITIETLVQEVDKDKFVVSPNPTEKMIRVKNTNNTHPFDLALFDAKGQVILKQVSVQNELKIDLPYAGLFLLKISQNGKTEVHKLIRL